MQKKTSPASEPDTRIAQIEARLAKLDPPRPIENTEPYDLGSQVYSIADGEGTYPLTVCGYGHYRGNPHILVMAPGDAEPRLFALESVVPLQECRNLKDGRDLRRIEDPASREFMEGKRAAQLAALAPPPPPPKKEPRFRWAAD